MAKPKPLPDNVDGLWRQYHGSAFYHRYAHPSAFANYQKQTADCGRVTRTGSGSYSLVDPNIDRYHAICSKCRKLVETKLNAADGWPAR